jgi:NAD(P)-dependent dehydrogenase (short-subunit alcohol dehydrogenase family)
MIHKVTLVTGANRGIGEATVSLLAAQGHEVIGTGRTAPPDFPGTFYEVDFSNSAELKEVGTHIANNHAVSGLVNNAGVSRAQDINNTTLEEMDAHYTVNLRAVIQITQLMLPRLKSAEGGGRIINIASRVVLGRAVRTPYAATKAALIGLTRSWALDLAKDGITVNCIAPGPVATVLFKGNHPDGSQELASVLESIPLGRVGMPEEIAGPIAFFLSPAANFVTGQTLYVCGGGSIGLAPV